MVSKLKRFAVNWCQFLSFQFTSEWFKELMFSRGKWGPGLKAKFPSAKDAASYVFMMLYSIAKRGDLTQAMIIISTYTLHTSPHPGTQIPSHPINPLLAYRATSVSQMLAPELKILDNNPVSRSFLPDLQISFFLVPGNG